MVTTTVKTAPHHGGDAGRAGGGGSMTRDETLEMLEAYTSTTTGITSGTLRSTVAGPQGREGDCNGKHNRTTHQCAQSELSGR